MATERSRRDDSSRESELEEGRMPFLEHLRELRVRLRNAVLFFMLGVLVSWLFAEEIYAWLRVPLDDAWAMHEDVLGPRPTMVFASIVEPFWVYISVALWSGVFVASPFIFHQLWKFVAPGLYKRERRIGVVFAVISALFFIGGAAFCYELVLVRLFDFMLDYATAGTQPMLLMRDYLDLTRDMMLAFGAVFELPILIYFLASVGVVTHRSLWRFNRWFIVVAFVVGAILTPGPDVVSQFLMATPMIVLYNLSIGVAWVVTIRRERRLRELE